MENVVEIELEVPAHQTTEVESEVVAGTAIEVEVNKAIIGNHGSLTGRDLQNQHPIGAITGLEESLENKQNTIDDLEEIRSGASAGATAVQPNGMATAISTHNTSSQAHADIRGLITDETTNRENADVELQRQIDDTYTKSQADERFATASQGAKADTALQPNDNVSELNNDAGYIKNAAIFYWGE